LQNDGQKLPDEQRQSLQLWQSLRLLGKTGSKKFSGDPTFVAAVVGCL
jgi:hypothetical protein